MTRARAPFIAAMSVAGDLLTAATPTRLVCRRGTWALEVVRFVAVDRNVFQPKTQRVEGSEAILQHLKRGDNAALAASATQLIRGLRPDEDHSLELVEGEWVPGKPSGRESLQPNSIAPGAHVHDEVANLRAELLILRAAHERLRERVVRLETVLVTTLEEQKQRLSTISVPPIGIQHASLAPFPSAVPSTGPSQPPSEHPLPANDSVAPPDDVEDSPEHPVAATAAATEPRMKLPPIQAINQCLHQLLGDRVSVHEKRPVAFNPTDDELYWMSPLIDDDGAEAGVIVSDLAATTTLGGILMMLPEAEIADQRKARAPSEDSIAAMSEVSNNLSATINQLPDAARVRVKPIQPMTPGSLDWAKTGKHRLELEVTGGGGRLFLFSR